MAFFPIGEWLPDQPDFNNPGATIIKNVVPRTAQSYGPMPSLAAAYGALTARCQGAYALRVDGTTSYVFAGDQRRLYKLVAGSADFTDISRIASFTASISATTMTVSAISAGVITVGDTLSGTGVAADTTVTALGSGTGGIGTYTVSASQTVSSEAMTSSGGGPYSTAAVPDGFWSATSFGSRVIFTNGSDPVQSLLIGTDTAFKDLSSAAPIAKYCAVIRDFLMLGNLVESGITQTQRLRWSAIDDPTSYPTIGTAAAQEVQSDEQDLQQTDLGAITGIVGGMLSSADGLVFCERGIWRITYVGSPAIFDFAVAEGAAGTQSPLSIVQRRLATPNGYRGVCYYLGEDDFYAHDGAVSIPLGTQKVAKWFFADANPNYLPWVVGAADPINKLIFWAYVGGDGTLLNRLIVFNWDVQRWSYVDLSGTPGEMLTRMITLGYTLDELDIFGNLDTLPASLDSRLWTGGVPALAMFDSTHKLSFFSGSNMAASVQTSEAQPVPGRRSFINLTRPIIDGGTPSVSVGTRERTTDTVTYQTRVAANSLGECPQFCTGRYVRFQIDTVAGDNFTHIQGVDSGEDGIAPEGRQ